MNIYVASSWRNTLQPLIVATLRDLGHEVYDFRHPEPGNTVMGQGKRGYVVMFQPCEPELMFREAEIITDMAELRAAFATPGSMAPP